MWLGKILILGISLEAALGLEWTGTASHPTASTHQSSALPRVLSVSQIPQSLQNQFLYSFWMRSDCESESVCYSITVFMNTKDTPDSPALIVTRRPTELIVSSYHDASTYQVDHENQWMWHRVTLRADLGNSRVEVCSREWQLNRKCMTFTVSFPAGMAGELVQVTGTGDVFNPMVSSAGEQLGTDFCASDCMEVCTGPTPTDCSTVAGIIENGFSTPQRLAKAKAETYQHMWIEGWCAPSDLHPYAEYLSFIFREDEFVPSRVYLLADNQSSLHICEEANSMTTCISTQPLQANSWSFVVVSLCSPKGFELCVGRDCRVLATHAREYTAVTLGARLRRDWKDLAVFNDCLSPEHINTRLSTPDPFDSDYITDEHGRRLAITHYSSFIYRRTFTTYFATHYYTFYNTHSATVSIRLLLTRPDGQTWGPHVYFYKPYSGTYDWGAFANPRLITVTPSNSKIIAKGGAMTGSYSIKLYEDEGAIYSYDLSVLIACSASSGSCFCPVGTYPNPSTSTCASCGGNASCDNAQSQGCLSASTSTSNPTAFSCSTCLNSNLFLDQSTGVCGTCNAVCATCAGSSSASSCVTCKSAGATLASPPGPSACVCKPGFYPNPNVSNCSSCTSTCLTCSAAGGTNCTSCKANASLVTSPTGSCACVTGYTGTADNCQSCHPSCLTCSGTANTNCQSCSGLATLAGTAPNSCKCPNGYYGNPDARLCSLCDTQCVTCSGGASTQCLTCVATIARLNGASPNSCVCNDGYYGTPPACVACDPTCSKCAAAGASQCTACKANAHLLAGSGSACGCNDGFFPDPTVASCKACDATCFNCLDATPSKCKACKANAALVSGSSPSSCACQDGYYPSPTAASCPACSPTCLKCAGGLTSQCTACKANATLLNAVSPGTCVCQPGYLPNPTTANCVGCAVSCKTCSLPGASGCTSCNAHATLSGASPSACGCNTGFYFDGTACQPCYSRCWTCGGPLPGDCLTCKLPAYLPSGTAPDICDCAGSFDPDCLVCDSTCKPNDPGPVLHCTGLGPTYCTDCNLNAHLELPLGVDSQSSCACDSHYFPSPAVDNCQPCDASCQECAGPGTTDCTQCGTNATLQSGISPGTCVCAIGYYLDTGTSTCETCDYTCKECSDSGDNKCTSCFSNAAVTGGYCLCVTGYFPDSDSTACAPCHNSCKTCSAAGVGMCDSCFTNAALVSGPGSACVCSSDYFPNPDSSSCTKCDTTCKQCSGNSPSDCTDCFPNAELENGVSPSKCVCTSHSYTLGTTEACQPCDATCLTCVQAGTTGCSDCHPNASLVAAAPSSCACDALYIPAPTVANCLLCHSTCSSCVGATDLDCTTCHSNAALASTPAPSYCECTGPFYPAPDSANCQPCHVSCKTCTGSGATECSDCYTSATLTASSTCLCDQSFFPDPSPKVCTACDVACKYCDSAAFDHCTECFPNAFLDHNTNPSSCVCIGAAFPFPTAANCIICDASCNTCDGIGPDHCTGCFPFAHRQSGLMPDYCVCDDGYFPDPDLANCALCDISCLKCSGGTAVECTSCYSGAQIAGGAAVGVCVCAPGSFGSPDSSNCIPCDFRCQECMGSGADQCTACKSGAVLGSYLEVGKCDCDVGYYPAPDASSCGSCDHTCYTCLGPSATECTSCRSFAELAGASPNFCSCAAGSYAYPDAGKCLQCSHLCAACVGPSDSQCTQCLPDAFLAGGVPGECSCNPGSYPSPDAGHCEPCPNDCATCPDLFECHSCKQSAVLVDGACECMPGYFGDPDASNCVQCAPNCLVCDFVGCYRCSGAAFLFERLCLPECPQRYHSDMFGVCQLGNDIPPTPTLTVTTKNELIVEFDQSMDFPFLQDNDILVEVRTPDDLEVDTTWSAPETEGRDTFHVLLSFAVSELPDRCEVKLTFTDMSRFPSADGIATATPYVTGELHGFGSSANATESSLNPSTTKQTTAAVQGAVSATVVMGIMNGDPGSVTSLVGSLQLMSYIGMTKIDTDPDLASTLSAINMGTAFPMPFVDHLRVSDREQDTEDFVSRYGIDSTLFLVNTNTFLGTSVAVLLSFVPVYLLSKIAHKSLAQYFKKLVPSWMWGVPVRLWLTAYIDMGVYSMLQVLNSRGSVFSLYVSFNLLLSYLFALIFFATPVAVLLFTYRNHTLMTYRHNKKFNLRWGVLFEEFKPQSVFGTVYYCVFVLRRFVFILSLTLTKDRPHFIAVTNCAMALSTFTFMAVTNPYELAVDQFNALLTEGGTFIVYVCTSTYLFDFGPYAGQIISAVGVWTAWVTVFGSVAASLYKTGQTVVKVVRGYLRHAQVRFPQAHSSGHRAGKILF